MTDSELFARHPDLVSAFVDAFTGKLSQLERLRTDWADASADERAIFKAEILKPA